MIEYFLPRIANQTVLINCFICEIIFSAGLSENLETWRLKRLVDSFALLEIFICNASCFLTLTHAPVFGQRPCPEQVASTVLGYIES